MSVRAASRSAMQALPRVSRFVIPRERLSARLHAALGDGLTVVQAPPGYGKTTLLVQFASEVEYATRWLSLDPACSCPEVLAHRLAATVLDDPDAPAPTASRGSGDLKIYVREALHRAAAESEIPLLVVVDNVHVLRRIEESESGEILDWLIDAMPFGAEVVLSSRSAIRLPEVDRRLADGSARIISKDDLAFTGAEVESLLAHKRSALDSAEVMAATAGWPMGVAAAITGGAHQPSRAGLAASTGALDRYVTRELWQFLPDGIERLLVRLSISEEVDPELAERLIGATGWQELSDWLEDHDFLLDVLPGQRLRLNPMLRHFLQRQFRRADRGAYEAAIGDVVAWHEAAGRLDQAFEFARMLENGELLADLLERGGRPLLYQGSLGLLTRAINGLRPALLDQRPLVGAIRARVLAQSGAPEEALAQAEAVLRACGAAAAPAVLAFLARIRAFRLLGRVEEIDGVFRRLRTIPGWDADPSLAAEVAFADADIKLSNFGDLTVAEGLLRECLSSARAAGWISLELLARSSLGQLQAMRGDGPAAVADLTRAAQGWRAVGATSNLGWVLNNLGMAHLMVGDFEGALRPLEEAVAEGRACENQRNEAYALASLAEAEWGLGRYADARGHYDEAIQLCSLDVRDETLFTLALAGAAAVALGLGDTQKADYLVARARTVAELMPSQFEYGMVSMTDAMIQAATARGSQAVASATAAVTSFEATNARAHQLAGRFVLAYAQFAAGRRKDAVQTLESLHELIREPWQAGVLIPVIRQQPMFAQWAASQAACAAPVRETIALHVHRAELPPAERPAALPTVTARSLGLVSVAKEGRDIREETWVSSRAKELFFVLLANRGGIRKEQAVDLLYPDLSPEKCNSAFHSNIYRVRKALYPECVIKKDGAYLLNPDGAFEWDVQVFESLLVRAEAAEPGSEERAALFEEALGMYNGPFAESFYSEWAASLRRRLEDRSVEAQVTLAGYHAGQGRYDRAADALQTVLEADPYNAETAYQLALYRARAGHQMRALSAIDECGRVYEEELGIALPARVRELRTQIAAGVAV